MSSADPDGMDDTQDHLVERLMRRLANEPDDTDDGGAAVMVPAPHKPVPHDAAIALPLPVEDDRE